MGASINYVTSKGTVGQNDQKSRTIKIFFRVLKVTKNLILHIESHQIFLSVPWKSLKIYFRNLKVTKNLFSCLKLGKNAEKWVT